MHRILSRIAVWRTMYTMFGDNVSIEIVPRIEKKKKRNVIACVVIKKHDNGMCLLDPGILVEMYRIICV